MSKKEDSEETTKITFIKREEKEPSKLDNKKNAKKRVLERGAAKIELALKDPSPNEGEIEKKKEEEEEDARRTLELLEKTTDMSEVSRREASETEFISDLLNSDTFKQAVNAVPQTIPENSSPPGQNSPTSKTNPKEIKEKLKDNGSALYARERESEGKQKSTSREHHKDHHHNKENERAGGKEKKENQGGGSHHNSEHHNTNKGEASSNGKLAEKGKHEKQPNSNHPHSEPRKGSDIKRATSSTHQTREVRSSGHSHHTREAKSGSRINSNNNTHSSHSKHDHKPSAASTVKQPTRLSDDDLTADSSDEQTEDSYISDDEGSSSEVEEEKFDTSKKNEGAKLDTLAMAQQMMSRKENLSKRNSTAVHGK